MQSRIVCYICLSACGSFMAVDLKPVVLFRVHPQVKDILQTSIRPSMGILKELFQRCKSNSSELFFSFLQSFVGSSMQSNVQLLRRRRDQHPKEPQPTTNSVSLPERLTENEICSHSKQHKMQNGLSGRIQEYQRKKCMGSNPRVPQEKS